MRSISLRGYAAELFPLANVRTRRVAGWLRRILGAQSSIWRVCRFGLDRSILPCTVEYEYGVSPLPLEDARVDRRLTAPSCVHGVGEHAPPLDTLAPYPYSPTSYLHPPPGAVDPPP